MLKRYHIDCDPLTDVSERADGTWSKYDDVAPLLVAVKTYRDAMRAWESAVLTSADLRHAEYVNARDALFALVWEES